MDRIADDVCGVIAQLRQNIGRAEALCRALDEMRTASNGLDTATRIAGDAEPDAMAGQDDESEMIQVYWVGCAGLSRLAKRLGTGVRIDRIGTSTERDLNNRLSAAAADAYGSWTRDAGGRLVQEPGFTAWVMQVIGTTRGSIVEGVTVKTRSLVVRLPDGMTRRSFDRALHIALEPWTLARTHPTAARFTNYSVGVDRMSHAIELYCGLDPRRDGDRLLGLVEGILAAHRGRPSSMVTEVAPASPRLICDALPDTMPPRRGRMSVAQLRAMRKRLAQTSSGGGRRGTS